MFICDIGSDISLILQMRNQAQREKVTSLNVCCCNVEGRIKLRD